MAVAAVVVAVAVVTVAVVLAAAVAVVVAEVKVKLVFDCCCCWCWCWCSNRAFIRACSNRSLMLGDKNAEVGADMGVEIGGVKALTSLPPANDGNNGDAVDDDVSTPPSASPWIFTPPSASL
jgi:hypothetical protein